MNSLNISHELNIYVHQLYDILIQISDIAIDYDLYVDFIDKLKRNKNIN